VFTNIEYGVRKGEVYYMEKFWGEHVKFQDWLYGLTYYFSLSIRIRKYIAQVRRAIFKIFEPMHKTVILW